MENLSIVLDEFIVLANQCFLVPDWVPTRSHRAIRRAVKTIRAIVDDIVRERREELAHGATGKTDLLTRLLDEQRSGAPISDDLIFVTKLRPCFFEVTKPPPLAWRGYGIAGPSIPTWSSDWRKLWTAS